MKFLKKIDQYLALGVIKMIQFYQHTISPDHSNMGKSTPFVGCKFYPSCSQYGIETLQQKGLIRGICPLIWRILRCHPWQKGGLDLPKK